MIMHIQSPVLGKPTLLFLKIKSVLILERKAIIKSILGLNIPFKI